jgi:hypothetical protein
MQHDLQQWRETMRRIDQVADKLAHRATIAPHGQKLKRQRKAQLVRLAALADDRQQAIDLLKQAKEVA